MNKISTTPRKKGNTRTCEPRALPRDLQMAENALEDNEEHDGERDALSGNL